MIEARAQQSGWAVPVEARVGNILDLPYADQSFDAAWCANTTQYLTDEEVLQAFREFRRVVRPGGLIAIKEYDATAQQFQPTPPFLIWHRHEALCRMGRANMPFKFCGRFSCHSGSVLLACWISVKNQR